MLLSSEIRDTRAEVALPQEIDLQEVQSLGQFYQDVLDLLLQPTSNLEKLKQITEKIKTFPLAQQKFYSEVIRNILRELARNEQLVLQIQREKKFPTVLETLLDAILSQNIPEVFWRKKIIQAGLSQSRVSKLGQGIYELDVPLEIYSQIEPDRKPSPAKFLQVSVDPGTDIWLKLIIFLNLNGGNQASSSSEIRRHELHHLLWASLKSNGVVAEPSIDDTERDLLDSNPNPGEENALLLSRKNTAAMSDFRNGFQNFRNEVIGYLLSLSEENQFPQDSSQLTYSENPRVQKIADSILQTISVDLRIWPELKVLFVYPALKAKNFHEFHRLIGQITEKYLESKV